MSIKKKSNNHKIKSSNRTIRPLKKGESIKMLSTLIFMLVICMALILIGIYFFEKQQLKDDDVNIEFKEDKKFNQYMKDYNYRFVGESEHFYFQTGQVYLSKSMNKLSISNLKVKKIDGKENKKVYAFRVFIKDKLIFGDSYNVGNSTKEKFENIKLGLVINIPTDLESKKDTINALALTNENSFKEDLKIEGVYCEEGKCKSEVFNLKYIDKEQSKSK